MSTTLPRTNKKVVAGVAAAAAAALALGAGTFAFFSDTEAGPNATATAGTLDLVPGQAETVTLLNESNMAPGFESSAQVSYTNGGSLPGVFKLDFTVTGSEGTGATPAANCNEPEDEAEAGPSCDVGSELLDELLVSVNGGAQVAVGALLDIEFPLASGTPAVFTFDFSLPYDDAGNDVQSDTVAIAATATLTQPAPAPAP